MFKYGFGPLKHQLQPPKIIIHEFFKTIFKSRKNHEILKFQKMGDNLAPRFAESHEFHY